MTNAKGQGKVTRNVLTDEEKLRLWDWLRMNRRAVSRLDDYELLGALILDGTKLDLNEQAVRKALKLLGLELGSALKAKKKGGGRESSSNAAD